MQRPLKRILFRLHWISGLAAGFVLAVVGISGAVLAFETELIRILNPDMQIAAAGQSPMTLGALVDAARRAYPDARVRSVAWEGDDAAVIMRVSHGRERGTDPIAFHPYSGAAIGRLRGADFFETVEQWHRNLAAGPVGKQIVGASTALLIVLAISGLVLRWPRRSLSPRAWLTMSLKLRGRPLMWHLHAVGATWLLLLYLLAAATGLWWSYDFYRDAVNGIAGATSQLRRPSANDARTDIPIAALDAGWTTFRRDVRDASHAIVSTAADDGAPIEIRYRTPASPHARAWNTFKVDANGERIEDEHYQEQPAGRRFVASIFALHSGGIFGWPGRIGMAVAALLMPLFFVTGIVMWMQRRASVARRMAGETRASDRLPRRSEVEIREA